mgnify:CR=1 FL=1
MSTSKENLEKQQFVICINNSDYQASLEVGKVYRMIPDESVKDIGYLRVIDESGEDYVFSSDRFFPIQLPQVVENAIFSSSAES